MKRLRILNHSWHAGHQYELHKMPHDFTLLIQKGGPRWKFKLRPLIEGVRCAFEEAIDLRAFDLAILHFDERLLDTDPLEQPFIRLKRTLTIPIVAICHGTPPLTPEDGVDIGKRDALREAVGEVPVVLNSHNAREAWDFKRARTIWHGFDIGEYPMTSGTRDVLTIANFDQGRRRYQGRDLFARVAATIPCDLLWGRGRGEFSTVKAGKGNYFFRNLVFNLLRGHIQKHPLEASAAWRRWVLNPYARGRFEAYRDLIRRYRIFFNPTRWSPMPRSRAEAMLCGLAVVTTNHQDEDRFIDNEKDGFYSNDPEQLIDYLRFLIAHREKAEAVGRRGRDKAAKVFSLDRFQTQWQELIREQVL